MQPGLLLVLTLLGMASALCPGREEGSRRCFMVVKALCNYKRAQTYCRDIYKGELASVHSTATNEQLRKLAATNTYCNLWIGAVTSCKGGSWKTSWEDLNPWNYANWASRQPCRWFRTCTVFNPKDGLWRSRACFLLHPFLCQY